MALLQKLKVWLAHPVQAGLGVILALGSLLLVAAGTYIAYNPKPAPVPIPIIQKKALELRQTKLVDVDQLVQQAELRNYAPSHTFIIDYALVNTGDLPIVPSDFVQGLTVTTSLPNEISNVVSKVDDEQRDRGVFSKWIEIDKRHWMQQPVLLNKDQQMPFTVSFVSGGKGNPNLNLKWNYQIVAVSDISIVDPNVIKPDLGFQLYLNILKDSSPLIRVPVGIGFVRFSNDSVWKFITLSVLLFTASLLLLSRRYSDVPCVFDGYLIAHILLLLFFSIDIAEIVICVMDQGFKVLIFSCYPVIAIYMYYLYFLSKKKS